MMHCKRSMEVNGSSPVGVHGPSISSASFLVLDDSCVAKRDLSNHVMGNIKGVSYISNLRTLIMEEGFYVVNLMYLGGLWVMIECDNVETKANMLQHIGVKSWFHVLQNAVHDFVSDEWIVWVDIEGISLNVCSRETFTRIGKKGGEALDIEDNIDSSFGRKRLCIKTKVPLSILESFKVIFKGKVYMVRAKELFTWSPILLGQKEMEYTSDEDFDVGPQKVPGRSQFCEEGLNDDRIRMLFRSYGGYDPGGESYGLLNGWLRERFRAYYRDTRSCEAVGNSGGILCVCEATVFKKDYATISDNFVAIWGTWLPSNSKADFGPIPFWFYHSWISLEGFDAMVEQTWRSFSHNDANKIIRFKKRIQDLKVRIRAWIKEKRSSVSGEKDSIKKELSDIDRLLDGGDVSDSNLLRRSELHRVFKGVHLHGSTSISHLFYADDVMFIGEWADDNLK
nr:RNA-directed DNA polymerase, eukaryota [Tanacetum cinerariifolium]